MFGGGATNPYDEIVVKATDENLTGENWEIILTLCDKVEEEGQEGAHNAIAAIIKRLAHRNPNVQLYSLSLAEALSKNLGIELHREISSKAFTQALERIVTDRTTHDKVRKRTLTLISDWANEFESNDSLGLIGDLYTSLKSKGYKLEPTEEPLPPTVDDEIRRKEEEELQRVLEMSMHDRGGRGSGAGAGGVRSAGGGAGGQNERWAEYSLAGRQGGGAQGASASVGGSGGGGYQAPKYQAGYVPARTPSPATQKRYREASPQPQPQPHQSQYQPTPSSYAASSPSTYGPENSNTNTTATNTSNTYNTNTATNTASTASTTNTATTATTNTATTTTTTTGIVTRVRALHTFEPTEPGELAFEKGDVIKVVDRGYKDWWRGQLKGRTGIFPVNYVEPLPEPTAVELAREAEAEAEVFRQAVNVEKLLAMLKNLDVERDSLAEDEEIQELYRSCMSLRPKIVKLIDKYSQKRADLVSMNEAFVRARAIFERMMEDSLARHTGIYDQQPTYGRPPPQTYPPQQARPGSVYAAPPQQYGGGYPQQNVPQVVYDQGAGAYNPPPAGYNPNAGYNAAVPPATAPAPAQPASAGFPFPHGQPPVGGAPNVGVASPYGGDPYAQQAPATVQAQTQAQAQAPAPAVRPSTYGYTAPYSGQGPTPYPSQGAPQQQAQGQVYGQAPYQPQQQPPPQQQQQQQQPQSDVSRRQSAQAQPPAQRQGSGSFEQHAVYGGPVQIPPVASPVQFAGNPVPIQPVQAQQPIQPAFVQQQTSQPQQPPVQQQIQQQPVQPQQTIQHLEQPRPQSQQPNFVSEVQSQLEGLHVGDQGQQQQPLLQRNESVGSQGQPQQVQPLPQQQPAHQVQQPQQQPQQPQQPAQPPTQQQASLTPSQIAQMLANGPPYVFDPSITYPDPNVQAWAQYYAQGGVDNAGAVYFLSVPGVSSGGAPSVGSGSGGASAEGVGTGSLGGGVIGGQGQQQQQEQQLAGATRYQLTDSGFVSPQGQGQGQGQQGAVSISPGGSTPSWVLPKKDAVGGRV